MLESVESQEYDIIGVRRVVIQAHHTCVQLLPMDDCLCASVFFSAAQEPIPSFTSCLDNLTLLVNRLPVSTSFHTG